MAIFGSHSLHPTALMGRSPGNSLAHLLLWVLGTFPFTRSAYSQVTESAWVSERHGARHAGASQASIM
jgi:hypothetical protein